MNPLLCPTYYNPSSSFFLFPGSGEVRKSIFFFLPYLEGSKYNIYEYIYYNYKTLKTYYSKTTAM